MAEVEQRSTDLDEFLGKRFVYVYENGWKYELYVKNARTIDYRIHSGMVGGRWVKDQQAFIVRLANHVYKISWDEPTGTAVSLAFNLEEWRVHGVIFFPRWIEEDPKKTVCFQNDHLDRMRQYRDAGPTYPRLVIDEFAPITLIENAGVDLETVIDCPPELAPEYSIGSPPARRTPVVSRVSIPVLG